MVQRKCTYALALAAVLLTPASYGGCCQGMIVSGGEDFSSPADLRSYKLSLFNKWESQWFNDGDWYVGGYFDLSINQWESQLSSKKSDVSAKGKDSISAIAFSPVFRITRHTPWFGTFTPFAEAGVGLSYLSGDTLKAKDDTPVDLGMRLQFEDRIGVGFTFGDKQQYQIILRAFHYSNASLHNENDGFNLHEIAFGYSF